MLHACVRRITRSSLGKDWQLTGGTLEFMREQAQRDTLISATLNSKNPEDKLGWLIGPSTDCNTFPYTAPEATESHKTSKSIARTKTNMIFWKLEACVSTLDYNVFY
jgi:hypothetical protein